MVIRKTTDFVKNFSRKPINAIKTTRILTTSLRKKKLVPPILYSTKASTPNDKNMMIIIGVKNFTLPTPQGDLSNLILTNLLIQLSLNSR